MSENLGMERAEFLRLKASIHYGIAGQRYARVRERFIDEFFTRLDRGDLDGAERLIDAFIAFRKAPRLRRHA